MNIYTCYSESHRVLFDQFFVPSLPAGSKLIATVLDQECPSGEYHSKNWSVAMVGKAQVIIQAIEAELANDQDRLFIFCDVDLVFLEDVRAELISLMAGFDILNADDDVVNCTGFMVIRANQRTLRAWQWIKQRVTRAKCDQIAFDQFMRFQTKPTMFDRLESLWRSLSQNPIARLEPVRIGRLPSSSYSNYFHLNQKLRYWDGQTPIHVSFDRLRIVKVFHANFTMGIDQKIALLEQIQRLRRENGLTSSA